MKKTLFLGLFLSYHALLSAQSKYTNPIIFLNDYCQKTGWDQWDDKRTVRIVQQTEGAQGTLTNIYKGEWGHAKIGKINDQDKGTMFVQTSEKGWLMTPDGNYQNFNIPGDFLNGASALLITPIEELKLRNGYGLYLTVKEDMFQDKPVYVLEKEFPTPNKNSSLGTDYTYYDKETLFKVGHKFGFGPASGIISVYSDYRQVGGFWYPFKQTVLNGPNPHTKIVTEFVLDENVDEYFKAPPPEAYYKPSGN